MKVSTRAIAGVIAATALIAPLALATSAQAAPKGGKQESRASSRTEAPREARSTEQRNGEARGTESREARSTESRRETPKPARSSAPTHECDDDAAPVVQLPA
jgi:hypothetical protein